ncbi:hypothetical protein R1flu_021619 [Riccia fluitans]|uniref:Uncharacterized protein n=1 Tax=Riccia fluitans TaxID=41844 RepID=A0ABD1ZPX4_9MARC
MATLPTSCGITCTERMIDPHSGSVGITSVASDSCSSNYGSPPKTFNMRDLLNVARKTPSGNGGSVMLQPSGSRRRIEKNVSTGSRHRMNRKKYEMIVGYLEEPDHLAEILGSGRKMKVYGKHPSKQTAFGVMVVHLASLGFPVCIGAIMQKKFDMYFASFKKAREWSMSIGAGLTEEEVTRGMTIEDKLNQKCPFYHKMYAIFGHRANIVPPATTEDGLPPELEVEEDSSVPITFLDSQVTTEICEQQFDLPTENQFVFQTIGNEGGSNVEVDENAHAKKGGSNVEGDEIAHAETENFDEEFGNDRGVPDNEMGRRPEEELEYPESGTRFGAHPFVHVQPSSVERPRRGTSSSQEMN